MIIYIALFNIVYCRHATASSGEYEDVTTQDEYGQEMTFRRRIIPTTKPSYSPTNAPSYEPTLSPTNHPTPMPTLIPTEEPTKAPTNIPTKQPTYRPTQQPTLKPTRSPTIQPTFQPTNHPTEPWDSKRSPTSVTQKSKSAKNDNNQLQESKILKQAMNTIKKRQQVTAKTLKSKPEAIELYTYHANLTNDAILAFEDKFTKNVDGKYNVIILDGATVTANKSHQNVFSCVTSIDKALYHQLNFMHTLSKGKFTTNSLFQDGVISTVLLIAKLDDQSIYDSIIDDMYSKNADSYDPIKSGERCTIDGVLYYLLNNRYQQTRRELKKSGKATMTNIDVTAEMNLEYITLITMFNSLTLKNLIKAKIDYIHSIITSSVFGKDGRIPTKIKHIFTNLNTTGYKLMDRGIPGFTLNIVQCNHVAPIDNLTESKLSTKQYQITAKKTISEINDFCDELSAYSVCLQTARFIYEWRKADKKNNRGTIGITTCTRKNKDFIMNAVLKSIGYAPSAIQMFAISPAPKPAKLKYKIYNVTMKSNDHDTFRVKLIGKSNGKGNNDKDMNKSVSTNQTSTSTQHKVKVFTVKNDDYNTVVKQFSEIANDPKNDLVIISERMPHVLPITVIKNRYVALYKPLLTGSYGAFINFLEAIVSIPKEAKMMTKVIEALADLCIQISTLTDADRHSIFNRMMRSAKSKDMTKIIIQQIRDKQDEFSAQRLMKRFGVRMFEQDMTEDMVNFFKICIEEITKGHIQDMNELIYINSTYAKSDMISNELRTYYQSIIDQVNNTFSTDWMSCVERYCCVKDSNSLKRKVVLVQDKLAQIHKKMEEFTTFGYIGMITYDWNIVQRKNGTVAIAMYESANLLRKILLLDILTNIGYSKQCISFTKL